MSSQFVDINADGFNDILAGSFSGTPQIIMGGKEGYEAATDLLDGEGEVVLIGAFWNTEDNKWDKTDRCQSKGHCTSASAVDWDNDGDLDLILGDYYGGQLFLRLNEGSAKEPKFAATNSPILANKKPIKIVKGLAAPLVVDWNNDGKFDIICGASKGGAFLFENTGSKDKPEFSAAKTLLEPVDKSGGFIGKVPTHKGQPTQPGSSFHIEACDYDGDGDLDLLVGARSSWNISAEKLTDEEQSELDEMNEEFESVQAKLSKLLAEVEDADERKEITQSDEYKEVIKEYSQVSRKRAKLAKKADPTKSGDFVWLYRRK